MKIRISELANPKNPRNCLDRLLIKCPTDKQYVDKDRGCTDCPDYKRRDFIENDKCMEP